VSKEVDEIINKSRENRKAFQETTLSYLESNSKNLKQVVSWYVELVEDKKKEVDLLVQIAIRYKEITRSINILRWALLLVFFVTFRELLYHIFIAPLQFIQYIIWLYQQAGAGVQLTIVTSPLFIIFGALITWLFTRKKFK
jgi:hypothetical protein